MHPSRIALVAAAFIGLLSLVLDFVTADLTGDVIGWDASAWPGLVLLGATGSIALLGDRREGFPTAGTVLLVLLGAGATIFAVAKLVDAAEAARIVEDASGIAAIGPGAWTLLVASLLGLGGAVATASRRVS